MSVGRSYGQWCRLFLSTTTVPVLYSHCIMDVRLEQQPLLIVDIVLLLVNITASTVYTVCIDCMTTVVVEVEVESW